MKSEPDIEPTGPDSDPTVPSEDNLKAQAAKTAAKKKRDAKKKQTAEEKQDEAAQAEHCKFSAFMAQQSTESMDMVLSQADRLYDRSLKYIKRHNQLDLTFTFTDQEKNTVNQSFFELYKRTNPEFMEKWGVLVTCVALVATVAIPRIILARKLNEIEIALDSEKADEPRDTPDPIAEPIGEPVGAETPK